MEKRVLRQLLQATKPVKIQTDAEGESTQCDWEGAYRAGEGGKWVALFGG